MDVESLIEKVKNVIGQHWKIIGGVAAGALLLVSLYFLVFNVGKPSGKSLSAESLTAASSSSTVKETAESSSKSASSDKMVVDVKGAVKRPDIYTVSSNTRLAEVIKLAGGFRDDADEKSVNLAAKVKDEEVIYVATIGENVSVVAASGASSAQAETGSDSSDKVNINTADLTELQTLSGIGAKKAQDIIDYRAKNGSFKTVEDLGKVSGFGDKTLAKLKDSITVD